MKPSAAPQVRPAVNGWAMPRLTRRAFTDLGLWMQALGLGIGVAFPFLLIPLGVPSQFTLRPAFFAACIGAGLLLGAANYALARRVIGLRVVQVSRQMRYVEAVIAQAGYSGDWGVCTPASCHLPVDSADELGEVAASFNGLVTALSTSHEMHRAMSETNRALSEHLELAEFAHTTLRSFLTSGQAQAGAFCVVRDGHLDVLANARLQVAGLSEHPAVLAALSDSAPVQLEVPPGLVVEAVAVSFRPAAVALLPIHFRKIPLGVVVLAFSESPSADTMRILDGFRMPTGVALNNSLAHERFQQLAAVDSLTGAYNRRFGLGRLEEEWARSIRTGAPLGVLAFDLDHFKAVNDTYGHLAGDRVLRETTAAARLALREGDVLVRTGGEEFIVVLPGAGLADVRAVGERIRRNIADLTIPAGQGSLEITVSLGGTTLGDCAAESTQELLGAVDEAMYTSKRNGRNQLTMAAQSMSAAHV